MTFLAETESYPPALYSWYFANASKPIPSLFLNTSSGTIQAVSKEHEGTYSCLLYNTATRLALLGTVKVRVLGESLSPIPVLCASESQGSTDILELEEGVVGWGSPLRLVADCGSGHREGAGSLFGTSSARLWRLSVGCLSLYSLEVWEAILCTHKHTALTHPMHTWTHTHSNHTCRGLLWCSGG